MAGFAIIDTPNNVTRFLPRLANTHTIIRYITRGNPSGTKHVKLPEVKAIKAAGKKLALVHQTWGQLKYAGRGGISGPDGVKDGAFSRKYLPVIGAPTGACVYFAVDQDVSQAQMRSHVFPYFKAVKAAFADGEYRVGVYGPGAVCQALKDAGLCDLFWLANAKGWKGYSAFKPQADLVQRLPTHIAGGLDVDPNDAQVEDWGQFEPFADDATIFPVAGLTADVTADGNPVRLGQTGNDDFDPEAVTGIFAEPEAAPTPDAVATAAGVAVGKAAAGGASPAAAAVAGAEAAEGMGAKAGSAASAAASAVGIASQMGGFSRVKGFFRSKFTWLTGGAVGGGGATATVTGDPDAQSLLLHLASSPSFWLSLVCIGLTGALIYFWLRGKRA